MAGTVGMGMRARVGMLTVIAILALLSSCGQAGLTPGASPTTTGPDTPVTSGPATTDPEPGGPQTVSPRPGIVDVRARPFDDARYRAGDNTVDVTFYSGIEECYGLDRVEVDYRPKAIVITLFEGRVPEAEVCIDIAVQKVVTVVLEQPKGDRRIVDGAAAP